MLKVTFNRLEPASKPPKLVTRNIDADMVEFDQKGYFATFYKSIPVEGKDWSDQQLVEVIRTDRIESIERVVS